jgi:hypothetical protein
MSTRLLFLLLLLSLLLSSPPFSNNGISEHAKAQRQHNTLVHISFSSLDNNSDSTGIPAVSNNFTLYDNSTYGVRFLSPDSWDKVELLAGRTTFVAFTSPSINATEGIELPAQIVISIERGLGNATLQQYLEAGDRLLNTLVGDVNITSQPVTLSGLPAISRTMSTNLASGIDIFIAQIIATKNDNAYAITYTVPASIYYNYLPTVEQVVNSFEITE